MKNFAVLPSGTIINLDHVLCVFRQPWGSKSGLVYFAGEDNTDEDDAGFGIDQADFDALRELVQRDT